MIKRCGSIATREIAESSFVYNTGKVLASIKDGEVEKIGWIDITCTMKVDALIKHEEQRVALPSIDLSFLDRVTSRTVTKENSKPLDLCHRSLPQIW